MESHILCKLHIDKIFVLLVPLLLFLSQSCSVKKAVVLPAARYANRFIGVYYSEGAQVDADKKGPVYFVLRDNIAELGMDGENHFFNNVILQNDTIILNRTFSIINGSLIFPQKDSNELILLIQDSGSVLNVVNDYHITLSEDNKESDYVEYTLKKDSRFIKDFRKMPSWLKMAKCLNHDITERRNYINELRYYE